MIPKLSAPLTKFIRTGEGILVFAANLGLLLVPIVTNSLSATNAARDAVVLNVATVVSRSALKAVTSITGYTGIKPSQVGSLTLPIDISKELSNAASVAKSIQADVK